MIDVKSKTQIPLSEEVIEEKTIAFLNRYLLKEQTTYNKNYEHMIEQRIISAISQTLRILAEFIFSQYMDEGDPKEQNKNILKLLNPSKYAEFREECNVKQQIIEEYNEKEKFGLALVQKKILNKKAFTQLDSVYVRERDDDWQYELKYHEMGIYETCDNYKYAKFDDLEKSLFEYLRFQLAIPRSDCMKYIDSAEQTFHDFQIQTITLPTESPTPLTLREAITQIKYEI